MITFLYTTSWFLDERTIEEEAEKKIGWVLKLIFAGTATAVAYQFFPYMGMPLGFVFGESLLPWSLLDNLWKTDLYRRYFVATICVTFACQGSVV